MFVWASTNRNTVTETNMFLWKQPSFSRNSSMTKTKKQTWFGTKLGTKRHFWRSVSSKLTLIGCNTAELIQLVCLTHIKVSNCFSLSMAAAVKRLTKTRQMMLSILIIESHVAAIRSCHLGNQGCWNGYFLTHTRAMHGNYL